MHLSKAAVAAVLSAFWLLFATAGEAQANLRPQLKSLLHQISRHYGRPVIIISGCRSTSHNRRVGGRRGSYHLRCMAADIRVAGVSKVALLQFARRINGRGGIGAYCHKDFIHIDIGPRREWRYGCGRKHGKWHKHKRR